MTLQYTQAELYAMITSASHGKFAQVQDQQVVANNAVREVLSDIDLRSAKRSAALSPNMFENVFDYAAPSDLKAERIIDIRRQVNRPSYERFILVDDAEFDRKKYVSNYRIAVRNENFATVLRIDGLPNGARALINECDSTTSNGTWAASGDATNITSDSLNYVSGSGAINFDTNTGATTAIIQNSTMSQVDLTNFSETSSVFAWVYIPAISGLSNFILRWGNDSTHYWSRTVTTNNEGTAFHVGFNLIRFDWAGATQTGTVTPTTFDYLHLTVTKTGGMAAATDWRLDSVFVARGSIYDVVYYTKYGWQSSTGTYLEESSATTDLVLADTDEIALIAEKGAELSALELLDYDDAKIHATKYATMKMDYEARNPSSALRKHNSYSTGPRFKR